MSDMNPSGSALKKPGCTSMKKTPVTNKGALSAQEKRLGGHRQSGGGNKGMTGEGAGT